MGLGNFVRERKAWIIAPIVLFLIALASTGAMAQGRDGTTLGSEMNRDRAETRIDRLRRAARVSALKLDWETVHDKFVAALDETITSRHERSELKLQLSA